MGRAARSRAVDSSRSRPGRATAPTTGSPSRAMATCTAKSSRPGSPNSRVPSSGSTIQTRRRSRRVRSSTDSSDSRPSAAGRPPGRRRGSGSTPCPPSGAARRGRGPLRAGPTAAARLGSPARRPADDPPAWRPRTGQGRWSARLAAREARAACQRALGLAEHVVCVVLEQQTLADEVRDDPLRGREVLVEGRELVEPPRRAHQEHLVLGRPHGGMPHVPAGMHTDRRRHVGKADTAELVADLVDGGHRPLGWARDSTRGVALPSRRKWSRTDRRLPSWSGPGTTPGPAGRPPSTHSTVWASSARRTGR